LPATQRACDSKLSKKYMCIFLDSTNSQRCELKNLKKDACFLSFVRNLSGKGFREDGYPNLLSRTALEFEINYFSEQKPYI